MRAMPAGVDRRADVVERPGARSASPAAPPGAMPIRPPIEVPNQCTVCRVEAGEQRHHVGDVGRQRVARRVGEAIGFAAADDVGADDAPAVAHRPRQRVEVAALARDAVGADEDAVARAARALPLPVRHAVQAAARRGTARGASRGSVDGARSSFHLDRAVDGRRDQRLARLDRRARRPGCASPPPASASSASARAAARWSRRSPRAPRSRRSRTAWRSSSALAR